MKIEKPIIKQLIVRYPPILSKSEDEINQFFSVLAKYYINKKDAFVILNLCPKIISQDLESKFKEFIFIFDLYH